MQSRNEEFGPVRIYPQDLGLDRYVAAIRLRATSVGTTPVGPSSTIPARTPGRLGRVWSKGLDVKPQTASRGLHAARQAIFSGMAGMFGLAPALLMPAFVLAGTHHELPAAILGSGGLACIAAGVLGPGYIFRGFHRKPLTVDEVEALLRGARDDLERAYLSCVLEAARLNVSPAAAESIRDAIRALGLAIERLPAGRPDPADVAELRAKVNAAREQAASESDPVILSSLERRAEALDRAADSAERSAVIIARESALREEMLAQAQALRLGIKGFATGATDAAGLADLADSVRTVAVEAASVSSARAEVDAALSSVAPWSTTGDVSASAASPELQERQTVIRNHPS